MNRLTKLLMAVCLLTGCGQKPAADSKSAEAEEQAAPTAVEAVETETADETAVEDADEAATPTDGDEASGTKFLGKIGPFDVTLTMGNPAEVDEGDEVGSYYYNDRSATKFVLKLKHFETVNLSGTMQVVLDEYSPKGNHTGTFDGHLQGRGGGYAGTFTNAKGETFTFDLMEQ